MADGDQAWPPFLMASAGLHGVALTALFASPRHWALVVAALVGNHVAIGAAGMFPRCGWLGPNITRLPAVAAGRELVGLTFDDGPDPDVTPAVLDVLDAAGARATFFCVGERAERYPDVIAAIRARGHGVENHSYSHPNSFALRGRRGLAHEIVRAQSAIEQSGGGRPSLFRAPAGIQNPLLHAALSAAGLSLVSWTRRGFDTVSRDGARVASRLTRALGPGDILLLHDGSSARDRSGRPVVLDALPRVLDEMNRQGLRSAALHAVLFKRRSGGIVSEPSPPGTR
jgi:peptidoglycan/xylan/chitin deacetylase (PgdA/CDA1 family)